MQLPEQLSDFLRNRHHSTEFISFGMATVMGNEVIAAKVRNLYGQEIVWGMFNVDKGKFKGTRLSNSANTEEVSYVAF